jgi:hypothetical protein
MSQILTMLEGQGGTGGTDSQGRWEGGEVHTSPHLFFTITENSWVSLSELEKNNFLPGSTTWGSRIPANQPSNFVQNLYLNVVP